MVMLLGDTIKSMPINWTYKNNSLSQYILSLRQKNLQYSFSSNDKTTSYRNSMMALFSLWNLHGRSQEIEKEYEKTLKTSFLYKKDGIKTYLNKKQDRHINELTGRLDSFMDPVAGHFSGLLLFQLASKPLWEKWNVSFGTQTINAQAAKIACSQGSWELGSDENIFQGQAGSVVFSTAMFYLTQQVYFIYKKQAKGKSSNLDAYILKYVRKIAEKRNEPW